MTTYDLIPSVERTLMLLEILRNRSDGVAIQDLLTNLDVSRSSLFVLLNTLKYLGYVEQTDKRGYYYPGPRLQAWSQTGPLLQQEQIAAFYHEANLIVCDETLALAIPVHQGSVIIAQVESPQHVRSVYTIGQTCDNNPISVAWQILQAPSQETIHQGYAQVRDENHVELALPICGDGSHADFALLFSAPSFRCTDADIEAILPDLREMAARFSYRLGAPTYTPYHVEAHRDPTEPMSQEQINTFLRGPWTARLACVRDDQTPHVVPVWQEWDGEHFYVVAWRGSQWANYVLKHPQVSLTVDEPWSPFRRVTAHGIVYPITPDEADYHPMLNNLYRRFLGEQSTVVRQLPIIDHAFRIKPEKVRGWRGMPG
jgi:DNA-binding IclR family transcriptional regulator